MRSDIYETAKARPRPHVDEKRAKGEEQRCVPTFRLLVRPVPYALESRQGYVARICTLNGFDHARWLLPLATAEVWTGAFQERTNENATKIRGPFCGIAGLNASDICGIGLRYWNTRFLRYCPLCLADAPYHRAAWQLVFGVACHIHKVWLRDECYACNRKARFTDLPLGACPCGAPLNAVPAAPCTADVASYAELLSAALHPTEESIDKIASLVRKLDLDQLLRATWFLGAYATCYTAKAQKIAGIMQLDRSISLVEAVAKVLFDWPCGFNALLDKLAATDEPRTGGNRLAARFGRFYPSLYKSFPEASCSFLREGFEAYITSRWSGQLARRNKRLSPKSRESHEWISIKEAAKVLKVRVGLASSLVESGVLIGKFFLTASGRRMGTVLKTSLYAERDRRAGLATLDEARHMLGVSRKRMYRMMADGTVQPIQGPTINGAAVWQFDRATLAAIKKTLVAE